MFTAPALRLWLPLSELFDDRLLHVTERRAAKHLRSSTSRRGAFGATSRMRDVRCVGDKWKIAAFQETMVANPTGRFTRPRSISTTRSASIASCSLRLDFQF